MRLFSRLSTATLLLYATSIHPGQVCYLLRLPQPTAVVLTHREQNRQETHMSQMLYHQTIMVRFPRRPMSIWNWH